MAIDRKSLVTRHNPVLEAADFSSPLTVGNGELCFTADITGMQTLYGAYRRNKMPLCTMAQWGWHTEPVSGEQYAYEQKDIIETEYDFNGRRVTYPVECAPGNERVYRWLRQNPHRMNLMRIGLVWRSCGAGAAKCFEEIGEAEIDAVRQELHLESGMLESRFEAGGMPFFVTSCCASGQDTLAFSVQSHALAMSKAAVLIEFPYGNPDMSGADWTRAEKHRTECVCGEKEGIWRCVFERTLDRDRYRVTLMSEQTVDPVKVGEHAFLLQAHCESFAFTVSLERCDATERPLKPMLPADAVQSSKEGWKDYWTRTGIIQLHESRDERANELERRIVLSQYLLAANCSGSVAPQETGLTCNSWYGKSHLEMYFWHEAYLPLWGRTDMLEKSLGWYMKHLPQARENAAKNGYKGARWPKMVGESAQDSPSPIAPLLIWQQPHIIYMLHMAYLENRSLEFAEKYYILVKETADFMADYAVKNKDGVYELLPPLIPVQECHPPKDTANPAFELEYWVYTLRIAVQWARMLGREVPDGWRDTADHMAPSPVKDGLYLAHSRCPDTYESFNRDHPSMLMAYGMIDSGRMDPEAVRNSLYKVMEVWQEQTLWGWDFAVMAMTAVRLGEPELAVELLLKDTCKNAYIKNGHNRQETRDDLPLYLPGNGSLLLAAAMMAAGYSGCGRPCPGFPDDGNWKVEYEGIHPLPC